MNHNFKPCLSIWSAKCIANINVYRYWYMYRQRTHRIHSKKEMTNYWSFRWVKGKVRLLSMDLWSNGSNWTKIPENIHILLKLPQGNIYRYMNSKKEFFYLKFNLIKLICHHISFNWWNNPQSLSGLLLTFNIKLLTSDYWLKFHYFIFRNEENMFIFPDILDILQSSKILVCLTDL